MKRHLLTPTTFLLLSEAYSATRCYMGGIKRHQSTIGLTTAKAFTTLINLSYGTTLNIGSVTRDKRIYIDKFSNR